MLGCSESKVAKNKDNAMNENQKERLLKIAETNPELAKEMMDFMKEERQSSQEPIAVKMVKAEEDKLTITDAQKSKAKEAIAFFVVSAVCLIIAVLYIPVSLAFNQAPNTISFISLIFGCVAAGVIGDLIIAKTIGFPLFKQHISKYIKFSK